MSQDDGPRNDPDRRARVITALFVVSAGCAIGLAVVYWQGGQPQLEGVLLAGSLVGLAVGVVLWASYFLPQGPYVGERHEFSSSPAELEALEEDAERGGVIGRRKAIVRSLAAAAGALAVAALFPLRSLGPRPRALAATPWHDGVRLITGDGRPVRAALVPDGGLVTVFPETENGSEYGQAVLVRVDPSQLVLPPGREDWAPEGLIVYSKVCTHAGCPVGLYLADSHELLCPCHQSAFDVLHHAEPVFGPAAAPLPQLPIRIDADGFLVARGDFSEPVGPAYWNR